jgi:hypothetical protein
MSENIGVVADTAQVLIEAHVEKVYEFLKSSQGVTNKLLGVMNNFAELTGRHVSLHFTEGKAFMPFPTDESNVHVIVGSAPPGAVLTSDHSHVCDIRVDHRARFSAYWGPTRGYGTVVEDNRDKAVAQIVGSNIYLFVPNPSTAKFLFEGSEGEDMYTRALALAWKSFGISRPEPELITSLDQYRVLVEAGMLTMPAMLGIKLLGIEEKIGELTEKLTDLHHEKTLILRMKDAQTEIGFARTEEISARDWERMRAHPLVSRMTLEDEALQVETVNLCLEAEGKRYRLGPFCIRLPLGGSVSIWSLGPTHPLRQAHPHMSKYGGLCFGNMTTAIASAMGEYRMADALDMILVWLTQGYDPGLADVKIEEWPEVEETAV